MSARRGCRKEQKILEAKPRSHSAPWCDDRLGALLPHIIESSCRIVRRATASAAAMAAPGRRPLPLKFRGNARGPGVAGRWGRDRSRPALRPRARRGRAARPSAGHGARRRARRGGAPPPGRPRRARRRRGGARRSGLRARALLDGAGAAYDGALALLRAAGALRDGVRRRRLAGRGRGGAAAPAGGARRGRRAAGLAHRRGALRRDVRRASAAGAGSGRASTARRMDLARGDRLEVGRGPRANPPVPERGAWNATAAIAAERIVASGTIVEARRTSEGRDLARAVDRARAFVRGRIEATSHPDAVALGARARARRDRPRARGPGGVPRERPRAPARGLGDPPRPRGGGLRRARSARSSAASRPVAASVDAGRRRRCACRPRGCYADFAGGGGSAMRAAAMLSCAMAPASSASVRWASAASPCRSRAPLPWIRSSRGSPRSASPRPPPPGCSGCSSRSPCCSCPA